MKEQCQLVLVVVVSSVTIVAGIFFLYGYPSLSESTMLWPLNIETPCADGFSIASKSGHQNYSQQRAGLVVSPFPTPVPTPILEPPSQGSVLPGYLPPGCEQYDGASQNFSLKDIIVRSAYFDDRPRSSHHHIVVFLIEVRISILKQNLITGCAVGQHVNTDRKQFEVRQLIQTGWVHGAHPELSHDTVFVNCFDIPVQNGSRGFVLYTRNGRTTCVESERPVMIPAPPVPPQGQQFTVAICCAPVYGTPPLLTEWLQYQRVIAVDHIHLIVEDSFTNKGAGIENEELKRAMQEGFVTIDVWKQWLTYREVYYHSQVLAHEDCIYRLRGTYDYIMLLDVDEFFIPRIVNEKGIHHYVQKCCGKSCGSCHFREFMYFPDCGLKGEVGKDGNITAQLVSYVYREQAAEGKSFHRSSAIVDTGCQRGLYHMKGYRSVEFPVQMAYIAHVRKRMKPPTGKC